MPCTTILIGKNATYDGSTIVARNEDSPSGEFCAKRLEVMKPEDQPRLYKSVLSHVEIPLPETPFQYTYLPNSDTVEGTKAGAEFIKTSTGFSKSGATFADVELMRKHVGPEVKVKAAGGISSLEDAEEFIRLGADRLGTSRIVKIIKNTDDGTGY